MSWLHAWARSERPSIHFEHLGLVHGPDGGRPERGLHEGHLAEGFAPAQHSERPLVAGLRVFLHHDQRSSADQVEGLRPLALADHDLGMMARDAGPCVIRIPACAGYSC